MTTRCPARTHKRQRRADGSQKRADTQDAHGFDAVGQRRDHQVHRHGGDALHGHRPRDDAGVHAELCEVQHARGNGQVQPYEDAERTEPDEPERRGAERLPCSSGKRSSCTPWRSPSPALPLARCLPSEPRPAAPAGAAAMPSGSCPTSSGLSFINSRAMTSAMAAMTEMR